MQKNPPTCSAFGKDKLVSNNINNNNNVTKIIGKFGEDRQPKRYFESVPRRLVHEMEASARLAAACFASADASKASKAAPPPLLQPLRPCTEGPCCATAADSTTSLGLGAKRAGQSDCQVENDVRRHKGQWDQIRLVFD